MSAPNTGASAFAPADSRAAARLEAALERLRRCVPLRKLALVPGSCGPAAELCLETLRHAGFNGGLLHVLGFPLPDPPCGDASDEDADLLDIGSGHYLVGFAPENGPTWILDPSFEQFQRPWCAALPGWPLVYPASELGLRGGSQLRWASCWDDVDEACCAPPWDARSPERLPWVSSFGYRPPPSALALATAARAELAQATC